MMTIVLGRSITPVLTACMRRRRKPSSPPWPVPYGEFYKLSKGNAMDHRPDNPRWPAEWEPHRTTWIAWPHQRKDWPGKFAPIPWVYAEIVRQLHRSETVGILVNGPAAEKRARATLKRTAVDLSNVEFHIVPTDRVWTRDS